MTGKERMSPDYVFEHSVAPETLARWWSEAAIEDETCSVAISSVSSESTRKAEKAIIVPSFVDRDRVASSNFCFQGTLTRVLPGGKGSETVPCRGYFAERGSGVLWVDLGES